MANPMKGGVAQPADQQRDEITQYLEQERRTTGSDLDLLSDGQRLFATKYVHARQSAFLSLDESDDEGTDASSSLYSRPSDGLVEVTTPAPALPAPRTPRSLLLSSPYDRGPFSPYFARKSHQVLPTPNSRREVSFWSRTTSAISCSTLEYYVQCRLCSEYDVVDGFMQCQCGDCYCRNCGKDLLLKAALGDLFRPPCCCCCGQQIPLDFFLPYIDLEIEFLLRTKYNDIPQAPTFNEMPKEFSQKWKQFQPLNRLADYIFGCGRTCISDAKLHTKESKRFNASHYLGGFRKYTTRTNKQQRMTP